MDGIKMRKEEIWKDIKEYEGLYQVSNLGNVKSLNYKRTGKEKNLKARINKEGYLRVCLCQNGNNTDFMVHRLVAQAFLDGYSDDLEVDHINTIRNDNKIENLRMCTRKENVNNPLTLKHYSEVNKGKTLSEETKKKLSESHKGIQAGENNPMFGKHHSEESKNKMKKNRKDKCKGVNNHKSRAVICLETNIVYPTITECARELGIKPNGISAVCKGKRKTCGKHHFKYVDDTIDVYTNF